MLKKFKYWLITKLGGVILKDGEFIINERHMLCGIHTPTFADFIERANIKKNEWTILKIHVKTHDKGVDLYNISFEKTAKPESGRFVRTKK